MFTGIVQSLLPLKELEREAGMSRLAFLFSDMLLTGLKSGASVAVNGTCLTVTRLDGRTVWFDVIMETLRLTNLGELKPGSYANLERSVRVGDELGGHILSGHVHGLATVTKVEDSDHNRAVTLVVDQDALRYIFHKGFVALNGASLTVAGVDRAAGEILVHLIPETLARTTFGEVRPGDRINLEVDSRTQAIVETTEAVLRDRALLS